MAEQEFGYRVVIADSFSQPLQEFNRKMLEANKAANQMASDQKNLEKSYQDVGKALSFLTTGQSANVQATQAATVATNNASSAFMGYAKNLVAGYATYETLKRAATAYYDLMLEQEQMYRQVKASYGDMADTVLAKTDAITKGTIFEADEVASAFASMHDNVSRLGLSLEQESALMSTAMNLAAVRGKDVTEVIGALEMAMLGNARGARGLGLQVDETTVKNSKFAAGLKENWNYLDENSKAQLNLMVIQDQASKYTGQAALATTSLSGSLSVLGKTIKDYFEPGARFMAGWLGEIISNFNQAIDSARGFGETLGKILQSSYAIKDRDWTTLKQIWTTPSSSKPASGKIMSESDALALVNNFMQQDKVQADILAKIKAQGEEGKKKEETAKRQKELEAERIKQLEREAQLLDDALNFSARQYELTEDELRLVNDFLDIDGKRLAAKQAGHVAVMGWIDAEYQAEMNNTEALIEAEQLRIEDKKDNEDIWDGSAWVPKAKENIMGLADFQTGIETGLQNNLTDLFINAWDGKLKSAEDMFKSFTSSILTDFMGMAAKMAAQNLLGNFGGLGAALTGTTSVGLAGLAGAGMGVAAVGGMVGSGALGGYLSKNLFGGSDNRQATAELLGAALFPIGPGVSAAWGAAIAQWLPDAWNKGIAGWKTGWKAQETIGASQLGTGQEAFKKMFGLGEEVNAAAGWGFQGDIAGAETLNEDLQYLAPLYDDIIGLTTDLKEELGLTSVKAEELGSVLFQAFKNGEISLIEATTKLRDFTLSEILAGDATDEVWNSFKNLNADTSKLTWIEGLKTEMGDLLVSGYEFTDAQQDMINYYMQLAETASGSGAEADAAFSLLQDTFRDTQDYIDSLNDGIAQMQEEYRGLQEEAQKLNNIMSVAEGLQTNINQLFVEQAVGWDKDMMKYADGLFDIFGTVADYKEQFAGNADLLAATETYKTLATEKLKREYMAGGGTEVGWQNMIDTVMSAPTVDIMTPLETESAKLQTELTTLGDRIVLEQQKVAEVTAQVGERIINVITTGSTGNALYDAGFRYDQSTGTLTNITRR